MFTISTSNHFELKPGLNAIQIDVKDSVHCVLDIPKHSEGSLYLKVTGQGELNLQINVLEGSNFKYLWINQSNEILKVDETININERAQLEANYGEMSLGNHIKDTKVVFLGQKSTIKVRGAIVSFNSLKWTILAKHTAKRTVANVNCNAIVLDNAKLHLEVIGKIEKGFSGSETHQMSRIMNIGENAKGVVFPMLLIDENDVAASHAASVGQPNEEHIYYLQSRGLTRLEALKLIITGYLMPIVQGIDDSEIQEELTQEIMKKVNDQWQ